MGTLPLARLSCRNAFSQHHFGRNCFDSHLGNWRGSYPGRNILPRGVYAGDLWHFRCAADLRATSRPQSKCSPFCLLFLRHRRSLPFGPGSIFTGFPSFRPQTDCPLRLQIEAATRRRIPATLLRRIFRVKKAVLCRKKGLRHDGSNEASPLSSI